MSALRPQGAVLGWLGQRLNQTVVHKLLSTRLKCEVLSLTSTHWALCVD
jgi:hypothetical protein